MWLTHCFLTLNQFNYEVKSDNLLKFVSCVVVWISACETHAVNINDNSKTFKKQLMTACCFQWYSFNLQSRRCNMIWILSDFIRLSYRIARTSWLCWTWSSTRIKLYDWNSLNWSLTLTATFIKIDRASAYCTAIVSYLALKVNLTVLCNVFW